MTTAKPAVNKGPGLIGLLGVFARVALGILFIYAAWKKVGESNAPQVFSGSILAYKLELPDHMVALATFGVPWTELLVGVTIILGFWTRASAAVIAGMLLLFIGLGLSAISRGLEIKCGCFGDGTLLCPGGLSYCHIFENTLFTVLALGVFLWPRPAFALDNVLNRRGGCCSR